MKYSYITDSKLRNVMISANKKRKFSGNSLKISKSKNKIKKIPQISPEKRKNITVKFLHFKHIWRKVSKDRKLELRGRWVH